jgi:hypothetical protein
MGLHPPVLLSLHTANTLLLMELNFLLGVVAPNILLDFAYEGYRKSSMSKHFAMPPSKVKDSSSPSPSIDFSATSTPYCDLLTPGKVLAIGTSILIMSAATPVKLNNLRKLLAAKSHQEALRLYLHQKQDSLFKEAVLVTLHCKWSARPPYSLTEIGIATYSRRQVNCGFPCPPGAHAEDLLAHVWSIHLRLRSQAYLPATDTNPEAFHFGISVFATHIEALDLLYQIWHQPMDDSSPDKGYRPVVCLTYGDNEALGKIRNTGFNFVPAKMDTTVAVINAQNIAVQAKITGSNDATIGYILPIFKIKPIDVGNAGNAATYITIIALLSVLRDDIYGAVSNPRAKPGQKGISATKPAQSVMQWLMERPTPAPPFGVATYCWRCNSLDHMALKCPYEDLGCGKCLASKAEWRNENANTHVEGLCVFK